MMWHGAQHVSRPCLRECNTELACRMAQVFCFFCSCILASQPRIELGAMMFPVSDSQFQLVYNILSFTLASMMATTLFLWMRVPAISARYQTALIISGLVTFIAAYHYVRIFNSWTEAYTYSQNTTLTDPQLTGVPFNDSYRYMDWLLTVPMLLMEIVLVMKLSSEEASQKCTTLGLDDHLGLSWRAHRGGGPLYPLELLVLCHGSFL